MVISVELQAWGEKMLRSIGMAVAGSFCAAQAYAGFLEFEPVADPTFSGRVGKVVCETHDYLEVRGGVAEPGLGEGFLTLRPNSFVLDVPNSRMKFTHVVPGAEKPEWRKVSLSARRLGTDGCPERIIIDHAGSTAVIEFCLEGKKLTAGKSTYTLAHPARADAQIFLAVCRAAP